MPQKAPGRCDRKGISLIELFDRFPDEKSAEQWLIQQRWPAGIGCPRCGSMNVLIGAKHPNSPFRCRDCRKCFSVRTGTVMQSSKLKYRVWVIAIYLLATNLKGVSSMKLHRDLRITQKTAWHLAMRLREACRDNDLSLFSGPVEVDEAYIGGLEKWKHEKNRTHPGGGGKGKTIVAGVKDRKTRRIRLAVIEHTDGPTLKEFIGKTTKDGVTVYTDEATAYKGLQNHGAVNHSVGVYVKGDVHTNGIESVWSMLKRAYHGVFHRMSPEHLHRYIAEFENRHNVRDLDTIRQMGKLVRDGDQKRLRYADLIDHGGHKATAI